MLRMTDWMFDMVDEGVVEVNPSATFEEIGFFPLPQSPSYTAGYMIVSLDGVYHGVAQCGARLVAQDLIASSYAPLEMSDESIDVVRSGLVENYR